MLLFADESEMHLNPGIVRMWMKKGRQTKIPSAGKDKKVPVFGAINFISGKTSHLVTEKKTNVEFRLFIEQLKEEYKGKKAILVIDNASIHHANKVEELFDREKDWLEVFWLPPYSPNLNLIERLWKHIKSVAINNYYFGDVRSLVEAIHDAFEELNRGKYGWLKIAFKTLQDFFQAA